MDRLPDPLAVAVMIDHHSTTNARIIPVTYYKFPPVSIDSSRIAMKLVRGRCKPGNSSPLPGLDQVNYVATNSLVIPEKLSKIGRAGARMTRQLHQPDNVGFSQVCTDCGKEEKAQYACTKLRLNTK